MDKQSHQLMVFLQESSESDSSDSKKSEPAMSNESHNPVLEASLEKALDAEEAKANNQPNFLSPEGKTFERKIHIISLYFSNQQSDT